MAEENEGDWRALEESIREEYFDSHATSDYNRGKLANNCKLGMIAYGIIHRDGSLTDFGRQLLSLANTPEEMYCFLARHILLDLRGLVVLQTVQDIQARGERVDLRKLRGWLGERGVHFPRGGKHPSIMRLWLEKAGVVTSADWQIDRNCLQEVIGASPDEVDELSMLTVEQKAFLKTLSNMGETGPYWSNEVEKLATTTYGVRFDEKNLPKTVLYPLQEAGYLSLERGTKKAGRGAKPFQVILTDKIKAELIAPLIKCLEDQAHPELRPLLRKPLAEILRELKSASKHVKGLALEALGFYLMRLIDLKYVATRLRGQATGGAEVDLIFEGARLIFSRWQIQCKNTKLVSLDDAATAAGLMIYSGAQVAVVVGTGPVADSARTYAEGIRKDYGKQIVLAGGEELCRLAKGEVSFREVLESQAPLVLAQAG